MKQIVLRGKYATGKNQYALVDDDWHEYLDRFYWKAKPNGSKNNYYAIRVQRGEDGITRDIRMHRVVLDYYGSLDVDHINQNSLDNRLVNLRVCSRSVNIQNMKMVMRTTVCKCCGKLEVEYVKKNNRKTYCSVSCQRSSVVRPKKEKLMRRPVCQHCKQLFETSNKVQMFCGSSCRKKSKRIRQAASGLLPPSQTAEAYREWRRAHKT